MNETHHEDHEENNEDEVLNIILCTISAVMALSIILLNAICIYITLQSQRLRKNPSSYLLISLLALHLFNGLIVIPLHAAELIMHEKYLILISNVAFTILNCGVCVHVLLIAMDRMVAVKYFRNYKRIVTRKRALIVLPCLWLYIAFICSIPFIASTKETSAYNETVAWLYFMIIVNMILPSLAIIIIYSWVYKAMKHKLRVNSNSITSQNEQPSIVERQSRITIALPSTTDGDTMQYSPPIQQRKSVKTSITQEKEGRSSKQSDDSRQKVINMITRLRGKKSLFENSDKVIRRSIHTTFKIMLSYIIMWVPCITYNIIRTASGQKQSDHKNLIEIILYLIAFMDSIVCPIIYCYWNYAFKIEYKKFKQSRHISTTIRANRTQSNN